MLGLAATLGSFGLVLGPVCISLVICRGRGTDGYGHTINREVLELVVLAEGGGLLLWLLLDRLVVCCLGICGCHDGMSECVRINRLK